MDSRDFGAYQVIGLLGKGGMGEVYRAHDSKLRRDVAIKTLPLDVAADPASLARFQREARMLAALNHPNIAAIYGIEESGTGTYLVLELVEGETLADRLARAGPVPLQEALSIAAQVVDALEAAHAKDIIHRDVKPANIKITAAGRVKVLDFGLAKARPSGALGHDLSQAATLTTVSRAGQLMGTPAYMSPEQIRGEIVDHRADIWAFGCVLFELLAGARPFGGVTVPDVMAAILEREPDWAALPGAVPERIRQILRQCLQKNAAVRMAAIADARRAIEAVQAGRRGISRRNMAVLIGGSLAAATGLPVFMNRRVLRDRLIGAFGNSSIDSIAVLPMANRSGDPDQAFWRKA